jgi:hypothetical protein
VPEDAELRWLLEMLDPLARGTLRRVLIHDQADRDAISSQLLRYRDERGADWADNDLTGSRAIAVPRESS